MTGYATAEHAAARLIDRDPDVPGLATLLDAERLGAALGVALRVRRVRYKRATSIVVAFESDGGDGWAAAYAGPDHAEKTLTRAARTGGRARRITGLDYAVTGDLRADRILSRPLRELDRQCPEVLPDATVLRHNPHRRVVLDTREHGIVKVSPRSHTPLLALHRRLAAAGVPVLAPTSLTTHAWSAPRWGAGDLLARPSVRDAGLAGAALAALHATPPGAMTTPTSLNAEVSASLRAIDHLLPALSGRATRLAERIPRATRATALVHGDFSADQVLTGDGVRLIDFDRVGLGVPERDIASFAAEAQLRDGCPDLTGALRDGYLAAGGRISAAEIPAWTAMCLLLRVAEPFRRGDPEWPAGVERTLALAEEAIA